MFCQGHHSEQPKLNTRKTAATITMNFAYTYAVRDSVCMRYNGTTAYLVVSINTLRWSKTKQMMKLMNFSRYSTKTLIGSWLRLHQFNLGRQLLRD